MCVFDIFREKYSALVSVDKTPSAFQCHEARGISVETVDRDIDAILIVDRLLPGIGEEGVARLQTAKVVPQDSLKIFLERSRPALVLMDREPAGRQAGHDLGLIEILGNFHFGDPYHCSLLITSALRSLFHFGVQLIETGLGGTSH